MSKVFLGNVSSSSLMSDYVGPMPTYEEAMKKHGIDVGETNFDKTSTYEGKEPNSAAGAGTGAGVDSMKQDVGSETPIDFQYQGAPPTGDQGNNMDGDDKTLLKVGAPLLILGAAAVYYFFFYKKKK